LDGPRRGTADGDTVHGDLTVLDPPLDPGARRGVDVLQVSLEHEVETPPGIPSVGLHQTRFSHRS
jgi:hypothetical protein